MCWVSYWNVKKLVIMIPCLKKKGELKKQKKNVSEKPRDVQHCAPSFWLYAQLDGPCFFKFLSC